MPVRGIEARERRGFDRHQEDLFDRHGRTRLTRLRGAEHAPELEQMIEKRKKELEEAKPKQ